MFHLAPGQAPLACTTHAFPFALTAKASDAHFAFDRISSSFVFHKRYVRQNAKWLWQVWLLADVVDVVQG